MNFMIFEKSMKVAFFILLMLAVFGCVENNDEEEVSSVYLCSVLTEETVMSMGFERLRYNKEKNCFALHLLLDKPFVETSSSYNINKSADMLPGRVGFVLTLRNDGRRGVAVRPVGHIEIKSHVMSPLMKAASPDLGWNHSVREIFQTYYKVDIGGAFVGQGSPSWQMTQVSHNYLGWVSADDNKNLLCANPNSKEMRASGITCRLYIRIFNDVIAEMSFRVEDAQRAFYDAKEIPELIKNIVVIDK